jgi:phage-related protein
LFSKIIEAVGRLIKELPGKMREVISAIVSGLKNSFGKIKEVGTALIKGLWNGINDMVGWIKDKIKGFGSAVLDGIKSFFGIKSPSREMAWVGRMLDEGLVMGIEQNAKGPLKAMQSLTGDMLDEAGTLDGLSLERAINVANRSAAASSVASIAAGNAALLAKLEGIYERLGRLQMVTQTGALVGEIVDEMDAALAGRQLLDARGV